jgi:hypothetical protein
MIGLPSLRALDGEQRTRIWLAAEATDMRCGFDRLAERVKAAVGESPVSGHLFVFRSRRGDRLKILTWGVSRRQAKYACRAALKMGGGLPKPTYRRRLQTTRSCCAQKAWW